MAGPTAFDSAISVGVILYWIALTIPLSPVKAISAARSKVERGGSAPCALPRQQLRQNTGAVLGHAVERNRGS